MAEAPLISIVDDDDSLRNSLGNLLRSAGFRVREFASADAFLGSPDVRETGCLILDVRMPGMNGLALQEHLASADGRLPIIFITSHVDDHARVRAVGAGAVAFLYKPFREQELLDAIDTALRTE
jgi:FixJ family two-component response regulator